jgi:hypothetical protein
LGSEALEMAQRIAHPFSRYAALGYVTGLHLNRREPELALRLIGQAKAFAAEQRFAPVIESGILRGAALAIQGATNDAVR